MLSKEELAALLVLLTTIAQRTALSPMMMAKLLGTSHTTMLRWLALGRPDAKDDKRRVYRHLAEPVQTRAQKLINLDETRQVFAAVDGMRPTKKVETLRVALDPRSVW